MGIPKPVFGVLLIFFALVGCEQDPNYPKEDLVFKKELQQLMQSIEKVPPVVRCVLYCAPWIKGRL
jgi:hypothetical protein